MSDFANLIGKTGQEAVAAIQTQAPELTNVQVLPEGSCVTKDYREDRARVFVDESGNVVGVTRG